MRASFWVVSLSLFAMGCSGATGPEGPSGPTGPTGSAGPAGPSGSAGPTGVGATGPSGATGATGAPGPSGMQGPAGPTGVAGPAGPQGVPGQNGANGLDGPAGPTGPMGPMGPTGPVGPTGAGAGWALSGGNLYNTNGAPVGIGTNTPQFGLLNIVGSGGSNGQGWTLENDPTSQLGITAYWDTGGYGEMNAYGWAASPPNGLQPFHLDGNPIVLNSGGAKVQVGGDLGVGGTITAAAVASPGIIKQMQQAATMTPYATAPTNGSFAEVPGMTITLTTGNSELLIVGSGMYRVCNGGVGDLRINVDGTPETGEYVNPANASATCYHDSLAITWIMSVNAGSHTVYLDWRNEAGTGTFDQGFNDSRMLNRVLQVFEISQ